MRTDDSLLRDPTTEAASDRRPPLAAPDDLQDRTVALLDTGKMRGDEFVDRLNTLMKERGLRLKRRKKPTNTRTAPLSILQEIADQAAAVTIALSDCGSCRSCSTPDLNDLDHRGVPGVNVLTRSSATRSTGSAAPSASTAGRCSCPIRS